MKTNFLRERNSNADKPSRSAAAGSVEIPRGGAGVAGMTFFNPLTSYEIAVTIEKQSSGLILTYIAGILPPVPVRVQAVFVCLTRGLG